MHMVLLMLIELSLLVLTKRIKLSLLMMLIKVSSLVSYAQLVKLSFAGLLPGADAAAGLFMWMTSG